VTQAVLHKCDGPGCAERLEGDYPAGWVHCIVRKQVPTGFIEVVSDLCERCQAAVFKAPMLTRIEDTARVAAEMAAAQKH
jgi:hypothetical protein